MSNKYTSIIFFFFCIYRFQDMFFKTSLLKFRCLGTSCLLLEGEKQEAKRKKVKEEIEMPTGKLDSHLFFLSLFLLTHFFFLVAVVHIVLCPIWCRRHALLIICTHPSNRFSFFFFFLLSLSVYCLFSHTYRHTSYSNDNDSNVVSWFSCSFSYFIVLSIQF